MDELILPEETELCKLALKYGADKCPKICHMYTPSYYEFLLPYKNTFKKVLEVGVGNNRQVAAIPGCYIGASLRMWRDFFPNAMVYGGDNKPECIIEDERLKTFYCDETVEEDIKKLVEQTGSDIDFVVDDACHHMGHQVFLFKTLFPLLKKECIYFIEDCRRTRRVMAMFPQYNSFAMKFLPNPRPLGHDGVVVFTKK